MILILFNGFHENYYICNLDEYFDNESPGMTLINDTKNHRERLKFMKNQMRQILTSNN
ncbi:MAG: hypothetical protein HXS48_05580 [Theionarchaea archaeon]|nr:hypothetical protein [Theionarchaea archaeon]